MQHTNNGALFCNLFHCTVHAVNAINQVLTVPRAHVHLATTQFMNSRHCSFIQFANVYIIEQSIHEHNYFFYSLKTYQQRNLHFRLFKIALYVHNAFKMK